MIKVYVLPCGSTTVDETIPFSNLSKNPLAFTGLFRGRDKKNKVPVRAYLIEHPKGLILVDTGWDDAIRTNPKKYEGFMNFFASPGYLPKGDGIVDCLKSLGYKMSDIDYCILTHMDIDHAGGIREAANAKHIMTIESELREAKKPNPRYLRRLWKGIDIETFPDSEVDLFSDGSVVLIPMHGHSAGMTAVKISGKDKFVIIAGDAGYGKESWRDLVLPEVEYDRKQTLKSLEKLRSFAIDEKCEAVLMTHDSKCDKKYFEL